MGFNRMKTIILLIALSLTVIIAAGCSDSTEHARVEGKVNVVTSFYPLYDFAQKIGGDRVHVVNLVPAGVEPHDWTPKAKDMKNIIDADVFLYNGAGFEGWADDFLDSVDQTSGLVVTEASKGADMIRNGNGRDQVDPHIWLSPLQAQVMAANVKSSLIKTDPANESIYEANYKVLLQKLEALDQRLKQIVETAPKKEIVVSHEAFGYIARDYGITQVGVMGLSPEAEPTPRKMQEIRAFAEEHRIRYILFEELVSSKLAETLAESLGIETLVLNPLEGLTEKQQKAGNDYFSLMENNLTTIEKALQ